MAYVNKTFVVPEFAQKTSVQNQTPINQKTGMAQEFDSSSIYPFLMGMGGSKPVKNTQTQITTPYARANMLINRDKIGRATEAINTMNMLKNTGTYALADVLANVPQQQGAGSWLSDFARGLGAGAKGQVDRYLGNIEQKRSKELEDLAAILSFDKAMGGTVKTDLGYFYPESSNNDMLTLALLLGNK